MISILSFRNSIKVTKVANILLSTFMDNPELDETQNQPKLSESTSLNNSSGKTAMVWISSLAFWTSYWFHKILFSLEEDHGSQLMRIYTPENRTKLIFIAASLKCYGTVHVNYIVLQRSKLAHSGKHKAKYGSWGSIYQWIGVLSWKNNKFLILYLSIPFMFYRYLVRNRK